jgi:hypothetical protein
MFTQLNPPQPFEVVGKGCGMAIGVIDYGPDFDLRYVVILDGNGEVWTVSNREVRGVVNQTMGRRTSEPRNPRRMAK